MKTFQTSHPATAERTGPGYAKNSLASLPWNTFEKIAFRFFFIYFVLQAVPLDWKYYRDLLALDWWPLQYRNFFYLARYTPRFFADVPVLADWAILATLAVIGTAIWSYRDRPAREYNTLLYSLRVILRYRLAAAIIAYGFIKLFPMQSPYPSLSNLNTNYGDFDAWKLFSLSLGIVPSYESFLGLVEIVAVLLLLNRKTVTVATLIILPFTGNVFVSNLAYEGGEYVYSLYLISIALFLLAFDAKRIFTLLTLEKPTLPNRFRPVFTDRWKASRIALKTAFLLVFVLLYGGLTYAGYQKGSYHYPQQAGLAKASGLYNVTEFRINNQPLPYSKTDPVRWQDVVFEKWATLSIRSNRPVVLEASTRTEELPAANEDHPYERFGSAGRHYYSYTLDSTRQVLRLKNQNNQYPNDQWELHYSRPSDSQIVLSGITPGRDSIHVVLDKINKKYLLEEVARQGRRKALKL